MSFAEQVGRSIQRKLEKAVRNTTYAANAEACAESCHRVASATGSAIPLGQPTLVGHHSERRHRRDIKRIDQNMRRSVEESDKAHYLMGCASQLAHDKAKLESREFVGNRISDAKREVVQLSKWAEPTNPRFLQAQEKLEYWRNRLEVIEAKKREEGHSVPSAETIKVGDLVWYIGRWLPVVRGKRKLSPFRIGLSYLH